jgi:mono/diheme cytochrome c family protein
LPLTESAGRDDVRRLVAQAFRLRVTLRQTTVALAKVVKRADGRRAALKGCATGLLLVCVSFGATSCRQDMHDQPKYIPLRESTFFGDARSARAAVAGTVARGHLNDDELTYTGKTNGQDATVFPAPVTAATMARGRERFNIYCSPCHGRTGQGDGMIVLRGYRRPPSLLQDRLIGAPVGHFFDVITNGFGAMPDYAAQIRAADRWAIIAYVRALQLSGHATLADVPTSERDRIR